MIALGAVMSHFQNFTIEAHEKPLEGIERSVK